MNNRNKDVRQLTFLYDWMRIARKPTHTLRQDIQLLFQLIAIPITESQLRTVQKQIDPKGVKTYLSKQDLLNCFTVEQNNRQSKEKELLKAFKYICKDDDDLSFEELKKHFEAQEIDSTTTDMLIKQLCEYENQNGRFDYKKFVSSIM